MVEDNLEFKKFLEIFNSLDISKVEQLRSFMNNCAVNFNLFKNGSFIERPLPFDVIPRIISKNEFNLLEKGLKQRVYALNTFLNDIYSEQKILKDGIIPEEFIFSSKSYNPSLHGLRVSKDIRTHISGIDLVKNSINGKWTILEDNLRVPSGVSYPLSVRQTYRKVYPEIFEAMKVEKTMMYPKKLEEMMNFVSSGGINVVLTPGRYNSALYEHVYLARESGATLAMSSDLEVDGDKLYFKSYNGDKVRVGAIYRRVEDEYLDPLEYNSDSLIGIPGIANVYRSANVAIINSMGNAIADDKGIYYFVPKMIKYYLGEDAIIENAPTYLPYYEDDMAYILENISNLVIKDVSEAGGCGVVFGYKMSSAELSKLKDMIKQEPRRFIAQELIEFYDIECLFGTKMSPRKADLRCYVLYGEDIYVWPSGLTRYALEEGNYLVNSCQGGGFKDTWVVG